MNFKMAITKAQPVREDLVYRLSSEKWRQLIISESYYPVCISRIPAEKRLFAMGSGDLYLPMEFFIDSMPVPAIAGLDSFRYDVNDEWLRKPVNKDNYVIVKNNFRRDLEARFLSLGPFKSEADHRLPDIPEEVYNVSLLR